MYEHNWLPFSFVAIAQASAFNLQVLVLSVPRPGLGLCSGWH